MTSKQSVWKGGQLCDNTHCLITQGLSGFQRGLFHTIVKDRAGGSVSILGYQFSHQLTGSPYPRFRAMLGLGTDDC